MCTGFFPRFQSLRCALGIVLEERLAVQVRLQLTLVCYRVPRGKDWSLSVTLNFFFWDAYLSVPYGHSCHSALAYQSNYHKYYDTAHINSVWLWCLNTLFLLYNTKHIVYFYSSRPWEIWVTLPEESHLLKRLAIPLITLVSWKHGVNNTDVLILLCPRILRLKDLVVFCVASGWYVSGKYSSIRQQRVTSSNLISS